MTTKLTNLKINLHITHHYNFHCRYCFAKFHNPKDLDGNGWKKVIDNLKQSGMVTRLNFAGGEPVLHPDFPEIVEYAYQQGFELSLITNGSLMADPKRFPRYLFSKFSMFGISLDSANPHTLRQLGCCDAGGKVFGPDELLHIVWQARTANPQIQIKVNTVVSQLNKDEQLTHLSQLAKIDRWKFLKMKPFENAVFSNKDLQISDSDFTRFMRHNPNTGESVPEYSLERSYIIIDNAGNLVDNQGDEDYQDVGSLLEEPFEQLFSRYHFDADLYQSRYGEPGALQAVGAH